MVPPFFCRKRESHVRVTPDFLLFYERLKHYHKNGKQSKLIYLLYYLIQATHFELIRVRNKIGKDF